MSNSDWEALGTWVGACVVLSGVIVAWVQLRAVNKNAVVQATLDYLAQYYRTAGLASFEADLTPAAAVNTIAHLISTEETIDAYKSTLEKLYDGSLLKGEGKGVALRFQRTNDCLIIATNYFLIAENLMRRGRLDEDLFLELFSQRILQTWKFAVTFKDVDRNARTIFQHSRYHVFAKETLAWHRVHNPRNIGAPSTSDAESTGGAAQPPTK